jgi:hypothetical protein
MNRVIYVGIAGKKFHGKDTFARFVRERLEARGVEVRRRGFADSLKEEVADFLVPRLIGSPNWGAPSSELLRAELLDIFNFGNKEQKEPFRLILQWWGVEFRRQMFNPEYWLRMLELWAAEELHRTKKDLVVLVPDLRMPNECHFIKNADGLLVKVVRPGMDTSDQHTTETALDDYTDWDAVVQNTLSLEGLRAMADTLCMKQLEPRL